MDPNQQPSPQPGYGPQPAPQPQPQGYAGQPAPAPATYTPPASPAYPQPAPQPPHTYDQLPGYGPQPQPTYDIDYLDKIAPPPPRQAFLSGFFGKAVIGLGVIFVLAVSLIVALGNQDKTGSTTQIAVRTENLNRVAKTFHVRLKSDDVVSTNTNWQVWLTNTNRDTLSLLTQAEVKPSQYSKEMVAAEKAARAELEKKLTDARLTGTLDRSYAREMAHQADLLLNELRALSKRPPAPAFKRYADPAIQNLEPIQKAFADYNGA